MSDLYRTVSALGPCLIVVALGLWFAIQEMRDSINKF